MKHFPMLGEHLFFQRLDNGLPVFVIPKPGYRKTYAFFATNYGSVDTRFSLDGVWQDTPAGVAHFLEHKMFDMPSGENALQQFARTGASPNAFTSHAMTAYHFEATSEWEENLRILLSFVSTPFFTPDSVEKEQGIIGQEIRMMEDTPNNRLFDNLMGALYQCHPVRVPIAGTVDSIARITADILYDCHRAFYHPAHMCLCVAGDVDPSHVVSIAQSILPQGNGTVIERDYGGETGQRAYQNESSISMEVSLPLFGFAAVCPPPPQGPDTLRFELLAELAMEVLTGRSSPLYARLYKEGLINRNYDYGFYRVPQGACLLCIGESRDPAKVWNLFFEEVSSVAQRGLSEELFVRLKKAALGARMRQLDSPEALCRLQAAAHFSGTDYFTFAELFDSLTIENTLSLIVENLTLERAALAVVNPLS